MSNEKENANIWNENEEQNTETHMEESNHESTETEAVKGNEALDLNIDDLDIGDLDIRDVSIDNLDLELSEADFGVDAEVDERQGSVPHVADADEDESINIHLGVVVSPDEYTQENIELLKKNLISKRNVKFCSEQFDDRVVTYNVVSIDVMPDAVTALLDEAIDDNVELNKKTYVNSVSIVIDIGSGTTDMASIQGFDVIPDSERQFNVGTNDAFTDIAQEVERKYDCGYIETALISNVVRFPLGVCNECGAASVTSKVCSCGGSFEMKRNMIKIGQKTFDISDIVNMVFNDKADNIASIFKRYLDTLLKVRGINKSALDTILIVGGGSELFGKILKDKITEFVGEYVEIKKANRAIWKSVNGLGKYVLLKKSKGRKAFQRYVFVDVGNFATKAKLVDTDGKEIGKPIELMTKIATPVKQGTITLRKVHPMMDLYLEISSEGDEPHPGDGSYFVSHLANKGKNLKARNSMTPKTTDELFYVMINSTIGVLLARDKTI